MVDVGLEQAFAKVRAFLEGDFEHPGPTLYDLQNLVGYNSRLKTDGPHTHTMPPGPALGGVVAVRPRYDPKDPEVSLVVEIEDKVRERHLRHSKVERCFLDSGPGDRHPPGVEEVGGDLY